MPAVMMVVEPTSGGTARHVVELARGCRRRGIGVHLVCADRGDLCFGRALRGLREAGVSIHEIAMQREVHPVRDGAAAVRLRRLIRDIDPDILHLHSSKAGALGRGAVVGLGRGGPAVLYTPHAYAFLTQAGSLRPRLYRWLERFFLPWTERVVAVSESEGRAAARLGAARRVVVVRNGVGVTRTHSRQGDERAGLRIGWLGRLVWQKDPATAVKVSFVLSRLGVTHELLLGGNGPLEADLMAEISRLQAQGQVRMLDHVDDTAAFHDRIDVLLMTSRAEGLPYVGLDAMARGIPIVGFDVPGVRDLVEPGVTGFLAPPGDPGSVAAHLARLARDAGLRRTMGRAARQRVRREFSHDEQIERMCRLYRSLAVERATRPTRGRRKSPTRGRRKSPTRGRRTSPTRGRRTRKM